MIVNIKESKDVVVLINYNNANDTLDCVQSIHNSTIDISVIIVDNASSEEDYSKLKLIQNDILIIRSRHNLGFAGGNNLAIKYVIDNYNNIQSFILLNNDTVVEPDMFRLLKAKDDSKSIVVPKMLYYDDKNTIWYAGGYFNKWTGKAIHYGFNMKDYENDNNEVCEFATGCCILIPIDVLRKIGYLDDSYFMYCEDTEYCLRAKKAGIEIRYIHDAKLYHKVGRTSGGEESSFCLYYMTRNRFRYLHDYRDYFFFTAIPFTFFSRLFRVLEYRFKRKMQYKAILRGMIDYHKGIKGKSY